MNKKKIKELLQVSIELLESREVSHVCDTAIHMYRHGLIEWYDGWELKAFIRNNQPTETLHREIWEDKNYIKDRRTIAWWGCEAEVSP